MLLLAFVFIEARVPRARWLNLPLALFSLMASLFLFLIEFEQAKEAHISLPLTNTCQVCDLVTVAVDRAAKGRAEAVTRTSMIDEQAPAGEGDK